MTAPLPTRTITLGLFPSSRGFGWAAFDGPLNLVDFGSFVVEREKNARSLARLEELLDRLTPEVIVLEEFERARPGRSGRVLQLCHNIVAVAAGRDIETAIYDRAQIQQCFAGTGMMSRDQIAEAVSHHVEPLRYRLPAKRNPWDSEDKRVAFFSAAALVLTHFHFGTNRLLSDLSGSAGRKKS